MILVRYKTVSETIEIQTDDFAEAMQRIEALDFNGIAEKTISVTNWEIKA